MRCSDIGLNTELMPGNEQMLACNTVSFRDLRSPCLVKLYFTYDIRSCLKGAVSSDRRTGLVVIKRELFRGYRDIENFVKSVKEVL